MKIQFISYSLGLCVSGHGAHNKLLKIQFSRVLTGFIRLQPVSGHNLESCGRPVYISPEAFDDRPHNQSDCALWAFTQCGYSYKGK